jgi:hypothetical protein
VRTTLWSTSNRMLLDTSTLGAASGGRLVPSLASTIPSDGRGTGATSPCRQQFPAYASLSAPPSPVKTCTNVERRHLTYVKMCKISSGAGEAGAC